MVAAWIAAFALVAIVVLAKIGEVYLRVITDNAERRIANVEEDRRALTAAFVAAGGSLPAARIAAPERERPERPQPPRIEGM